MAEVYRQKRKPKEPNKQAYMIDLDIWYDITVADLIQMFEEVGVHDHSHMCINVRQVDEYDRVTGFDFECLDMEAYLKALNSYKIKVEEVKKYNKKYAKQIEAQKLLDKKETRKVNKAKKKSKYTSKIAELNKEIQKNIAELEALENDDEV